MNADTPALAGERNQTELRWKKRNAGEGDPAQAETGSEPGQDGVSRREADDRRPSEEEPPHNSRRERVALGWDLPGGSRLGAQS
jgi:hypothetical protein